MNVVYHLMQLVAVCTDTDLNFLCALKDHYEMKIITVRQQVLQEQKTVSRTNIANPPTNYMNCDKI